MAGNTIAKLAVVVTTDTSPMAAGFRRGSDIINKSAAEMNGRFDRAAESLKFLKDAAGASTGSVRDMAGVLRSGAGPLGIASVGVLAFGAALLKSAKAADELQLRAVKSADEIEAAYKKATGRDIDIGFNRLDTWTGQWERLKEAVLQFGGALAGRMGTLEAFKNATESLANAIGQLAERFKTEDQKADEKWLEVSRKGLEAQIKLAEREAMLAEKRNQRALESIRERGRILEESARRAASIMDSVKTPAEKFDDKIAELMKLLQEGWLDDSTFERAFRKAQEDFKNATKTTDTSPRGAGGAVERFTMAGYSAVTRGADASKKAEIDKAIAKNTADTKNRLAEVVTELRKKNSQPDLMVSNF